MCFTGFFTKMAFTFSALKSLAYEGVPFKSQSIEAGKFLLAKASTGNGSVAESYIQQLKNALQQNEPGSKERLREILGSAEEFWNSIGPQGQNSLADWVKENLSVLLGQARRTLSSGSPLNNRTRFLAQRLGDAIRDVNEAQRQNAGLSEARSRLNSLLYEAKTFVNRLNLEDRQRVGGNLIVLEDYLRQAERAYKSAARATLPSPPATLASARLNGMVLTQLFLGTTQNDQGHSKNRFQVFANGLPLVEVTTSKAQLTARDFSSPYIAQRLGALVARQKAPSPQKVAQTDWTNPFGSIKTPSIADTSSASPSRVAFGRDSVSAPVPYTSLNAPPTYQTIARKLNDDKKGRANLSPLPRTQQLASQLSQSIVNLQDAVRSKGDIKGARTALNNVLYTSSEHVKRILPQDRQTVANNLKTLENFIQQGKLLHRSTYASVTKNNVKPVSQVPNIDVLKAVTPYSAGFELEFSLASAIPIPGSAFLKKIPGLRRFVGQNLPQDTKIKLEILFPTNALSNGVSLDDLKSVIIGIKIAPPEGTEFKLAYDCGTGFISLFSENKHFEGKIGPAKISAKTIAGTGAEIGIHSGGGLRLGSAVDMAFKIPGSGVMFNVLGTSLHGLILMLNTGIAAASGGSAAFLAPLSQILGQAVNNFVSSGSAYLKFSYPGRVQFKTGEVPEITIGNNKFPLPQALSVMSSSLAPKLGVFGSLLPK